MVILLNCSFRGEKSNSNYFLGRLADQLSSDYVQKNLCQIKDIDTFRQEIDSADALVLGMPLYVDGAPAQVIELMEQLQEKGLENASKLRVYVVSNLGFYESQQIHILLSIVGNWCVKMKMTYGGGLAIGAGEMMGSLRSVPLDQGPNRMMGGGMKTLASHIDAGTIMENIYTEPNGFSRGMYRMAADMGWAPQAKKNGLKKKDIRRRLG